MTSVPRARSELTQMTPLDHSVLKWAPGSTKQRSCARYVAPSPGSTRLGLPSPLSKHRTPQLSWEYGSRWNMPDAPGRTGEPGSETSWEAGHQEPGASEADEPQPSPSVCTSPVGAKPRRWAGLATSRHMPAAEPLASQAGEQSTAICSPTKMRAE